MSGPPDVHLWDGMFRIAGKVEVDPDDLERLVAEVRQFDPLEPWGTLRVWGHLLAVDGQLTEAGRKVSNALIPPGDVE